MKFGAVFFAIFLWLVPGVFLFNILAARMREKALKKFAQEPLLSEISKEVDVGRKNFKGYLVVVVVLLAVLALMRPQWGFQWQEVKRQGLDILIAVDTSKSMLAEDVLPNRLQRSKLAIKDMVKKLKGDRVGLIAFSGNAFLQCPLTLDYDGFLLALDDIGVDSVPVGGTSLSQAIYTAINSYEGGINKNKILIIITDGEDLEGGLDLAIQKAKADKISIYTVGIGSKEGELVPIKTRSAGMSFLKDNEGNVVKTSLNEETLQRLALETGGMYVHSSGVEFGLDLIYREKLSKLVKKDFKTRMKKKYFERFQLLLFPALIILLVEPFIGDKKRKARSREDKK